MATYQVESERFVVRCPGCGHERWLSYRNRKSSALCAPCRWPDSERGKPTDAERAWWLRRFDDETIAQLGEALFGIGDLRAVRSWRARLLDG